MYDYLVVGSGLYGAIFAHEAKAHGKSVLVVDKRPNIAGNIYTESVEGINVHKYGAHIFHTNNKKVWSYITQFAEFNRFTNSPVANYKGELYSLPFNMYTFNKMWGVVTPEEAAAKIEEQRKEITGEPQNLEEQAISLVGRDIYEKLIKGYTEKQWGRDCKELPSFIIKRLPVRLTFDNNYFNALYQGIPVGGYTKMIANLLDGIEIRLNTDYLENKAELDNVFANVEFYFEERRFVLIGSVMAAVLNLLLNWIFIPVFGYYAAGYTTLICYIIYGLSHLGFSRLVIKKHLNDEQVFDGKFIIFMSAIVVATTVGLNYLYSFNALRYSILSIILVVIFIKRQAALNILKMAMSLKQR